MYVCVCVCVCVHVCVCVWSVCVGRGGNIEGFQMSDISHTSEGKCTIKRQLYSRPLTAGFLSLAVLMVRTQCSASLSLLA